MIGFAATVLLLVVVVTAMPFRVPHETFKEDITAGVGHPARCKLDIPDKMSLTPYPSVTIEIGVVTFANIPGGA